jgi:hypothetical protein
LVRGKEEEGGGGGEEGGGRRTQQVTTTRIHLHERRDLPHYTREAEDAT